VNTTAFTGRGEKPRTQPTTIGPVCGPPVSISTRPASVSKAHTLAKLETKHARSASGSVTNSGANGWRSSVVSAPLHN